MNYGLAQSKKGIEKKQIIRGGLSVLLTIKYTIYELSLAMINKVDGSTFDDTISDEGVEENL